MNSNNNKQLPQLYQVLAGPGSGKTEVVCQRCLALIGNMVKEGLSVEDAAAKILLITFTNAGANEMKTRLITRLATQGYPSGNGNVTVILNSDNIKAMTFNSFAMDIDKMFWQELGYQQELKKPLEGASTERGAIIADILRQSPITGLAYGKATFQGAPKDISSVITFFDFIKNNRYDADTIGLAGILQAEFEKKYPDVAWPEVVDAYMAYDERLKSEGLMEFSDQEPAALKMIDAHPELLKDLGYRHIIIDEAQDTSPIQMEFMKRFGKENSIVDIMEVGDDFQSIYGFRNADPGNMIHFEQRMGRPVKQFLLTDNYRSVKNVVSFANKVIELNKHRIVKTITATREDGEKVILKPFYNSKTEINYDAWKIKLLIDQKGVNPSDICFMARTRATVNKMASKLTEIGVPCIIKTPTSVAKNPAVQAVQALSKAIETPNATECYIQYLVAKYKGKLIADGRTKQMITDEIEQMKKRFQMFNLLDFDQQKQQFHKLVNALDERDEVFKSYKDRIYQYEDFYDEISFIDNSCLYGQEEEVKLAADYDNAVILTTCHSSKGLEWPYVVVSISDFDNPAINKLKVDDGEVEELRRLEFVAFTRARDHLLVTGTYKCYDKITKAGNHMTLYNRFLEELMGIEGLTYEPADPNEAIRAKHQAQLRAERAKAQAKARKEKAKEKEIQTLERLKAKQKSGQILSILELDKLSKLQKKYK
ncbi:DNA helicase-2 / ATP-dependent DNA helicase PcrA [Lachnospiraceae bacterium KHCPX20]|nr:DNA helicase-2 / ATP-dependent DNA helicase PcrA [Lachnospiraceae bacterium KHCPX20]